MRLPVSKLHRGFAELDAFSDEQCALLLRRIELRPIESTGVMMVAVGVFCGVALPLVIVFIQLQNRAATPSWLDLSYREGFLVWAGLFLIVPTICSLLARDAVLRRLLRRAIRYRLDRMRCLDCGYVLAGQTPLDDSVLCPECGEVHVLESLGLESRDLLAPFSMEGAPCAYSSMTPAASPAARCEQ